MYANKFTLVACGKWLLLVAPVPPVAPVAAVIVIVMVGVVVFFGGVIVALQVCRSYSSYSCRGGVGVSGAIVLCGCPACCSPLGACFWCQCATHATRIGKHYV